jgi:drug/metabolite transporter (DMT)-like permease
MSVYKVYILLALCVLFWSGNFVLGRFIHQSIDPIELAFFRWLFTLLFLTPLFFVLDLKKIFITIKNHFIIMSVLALLGITLYNTLLYTALETTTATNALLINSCVPIVILLYSFLILKTHISSVQMLGIILSTLGVMLLVLKGNPLNIMSLNFQTGDFWIIVSANIWALYSVLVRFKPKSLNHIELFFALVLLGFVYLLPTYYLQGYSVTHEMKQIKTLWPFFIYISFFTSILSYYFWHIGIDCIGAEKTGQFTHLMPLFGSFLAFIFLGETLAFYHIIGALFIGCGIYLGLFLKGHYE